MTENHAPQGFIAVETLADSYAGLICDTCGSVVARPQAQKHLDWHEQETVRMAAVVGEYADEVDRRARYNP